MNKFILVWLLLAWVYIAQCQVIIVTDHETEEPIELATITSEDPKVSTISNTKGMADISDFAGSEKIEFRSLGYKTAYYSFSDIEKSDFKVKLEATNLNLEEIVVSATRWMQTSGNIPSKVTTISSKDIVLQNPQTAADLLGISGKVFIQKSQQGGGSPMIRGFATNRLLYAVDGVRMNTAIFRSGNLQNVINLDPFAIENTEVLFGPGSIIYGSDAIGGVMSFQTLTPQVSLVDKPMVAGKAITRYSSANNEKTEHFDVNIGWKKWAITTSLSSWDFDNLRQGRHGPDDYLKPYYVKRIDSTDRIITQDDPLLQIPSAYSQINFMQKIRFKPTANWDLQYGFHYSETSPYGRYDRHNRKRNGTARYAEWNYGPQIWMFNNLKITHAGKNKFYDQMSIRLAQQSFEESRINRSLNRNERSTQTENVEAYSANIDFIKSVGIKNTFYYGFEYVLDDVTSKGMVTDISTGEDQEGPARYPESTWNSIAGYINDEFRISDMFTLRTGLRYNMYLLHADFSNNIDYYPFSFTTADVNNDALTGSIGAVFHPNESWVINANFGTAFRSPNVDDIGKVFDSEPGAVTVPNPDLKAEYAYNTELGVAKVFNKTVKLELTGFYTLLENALVRRNFQLNGQDSIMYDGVLSQVQALQNAAAAVIYGIQSGLEIKLPVGFRLASDLNYQVGKEELDDGTTSNSRHAAPLFGTSSLSYMFNKLSVQFKVNYQGERSYEDLPVEEQGKDEIYAKDKNGMNYSPAWYTLNIKAMYSLTETFTISAGIENITDQRYRPYSSGISGPGRNFIAAIRADF